MATLAKKREGIAHLCGAHGEKRRSRADLMLNHRDTQLAGFVGKVLLDPGAGEDENADRQDVQHRIVALERGRAAVLGPVGPKGDLQHLAVIGPAGGDEFRALG